MADEEVSLEDQASPADQGETNASEVSRSPQPTPADGEADRQDPEAVVDQEGRDAEGDEEDAAKDETGEAVDKKETAKTVAKDEEVKTDEAPAAVIETTRDDHEKEIVKDETATAKDEKEVAKDEVVEKDEEDDAKYKSHRRQRGTGSSSEEEQEEEVVSDQQEEDHGEEGEVTEEEESDAGWVEERKSPVQADDDSEEKTIKEGEETIDKKDPTFVPRGRYFHHDNRENDDGGGEEIPEFSKALTRSEVVEKWEHDLYVEADQVPRTPEEKKQKRDQRFYENTGRNKDQQRYESRGDNRRGVQLRQFFPPEQRERGHQSDRDRRKVSSEREEGSQEQTEYSDRRQRNDYDGERRRGGANDRQQRGSGYRDGNYQSNRQQQRDYNDTRQTNRHRLNKWDEVDQVRTRGKVRREERRDENTKEEQDLRIIESKNEKEESVIDESAPKLSPSPQKHSDKSSPPSKSPKSLFHQKPAPMPSRVFTLGKHSDLIVRDVPSKTSGPGGSAFAKRPVGRGRGRGRGMVVARQQTVPGGTKVVAPFSATVIPSSTHVLRSDDDPSTSLADQDPIDSSTKEPTINESETESTTEPSEIASTKKSYPSAAQPAKTTSILGSPPLDSNKPKRYSSRRQKGGGAVPLTATPTIYTENEGPQPGTTMPPPGSMSPYHPMPLDPAMFHQQQAMWAAAFMQQQMMYQQQQQLIMAGVYPPVVAPSPAGPPPMMEQYIEPATAQQLAAYSPPQPPLPSDGEAAAGLFIPGMDPAEQQRMIQTKRSSSTSLQQKPNQAIPIVSPEEK